MTSRRVWSVLLGLVIVASVFSPPAQAATLVTLSAHVTNTDEVDQAGSVCLELAGPPSSCGGTNLTSGGLWSRNWDVDASPGDYLIRVTSSTMDGASRWYVAGDSAGTTNRDLATVVHLAPGADPLHFDMVMPAIAKVTGTVKDADGTPVEGATVFRNQLGHSRSAVTNALGAYDFGYVRAGVHSLSVNPVGDYSGTSGSMTVPASGPYVAPLLTVQTAASIHGQVTDSVTNEPVPMVNVEVYTAGSHQYQGSAYTDLDGQYRIPQLGNQELVARFTHEFGGYASKLYVGGDPTDWSGEVPFTLDPEEDRTVPMTLDPLEPAVPAEFNLSGTVTDPDGNPIAGIRVGAPGLSDDVTDRLGNWYIDAPVGTYRLRVEDDGYWSNRLFDPGPTWFPEYYPNASRAAAATVVTVVAGVQQDGLDVELTRGAFIKGSVIDASDPSATGISTHWLVYGPSGQLENEQEYPGYFSGPDYKAMVRPGTWRLVLRGQHFVNPNMVDYLPRWFGDGDSFADATPVIVTAGETVTGYDVRLPSDFSSVASPTVSGTKAVGGVLAATTGSWTTMTLTQFDTTWWRGDTQVGSGPSYLVRAADAGSDVRARVVATNGTHTATAHSSPAAIAKLTSAVATTGKSPKHRVVKLTIAVGASGLTPAGTLTVKRGTKVVKRGVVLVGGAAVIRLRRQPSGRQRYTVSYAGSDQVLPGSAAVRVRVR